MLQSNSVASADATHPRHALPNTRSKANDVTRNCEHMYAIRREASSLFGAQLDCTRAEATDVEELWKHTLITFLRLVSGHCDSDVNRCASQKSDISDVVSKMTRVGSRSVRDRDAAEKRRIEVLWDY